LRSPMRLPTSTVWPLCARCDALPHGKGQPSLLRKSGSGAEAPVLTEQFGEIVQELMIETRDERTTSKLQRHKSTHMGIILVLQRSRTEFLSITAAVSGLLVGEQGVVDSFDVLSCVRASSPSRIPTRLTLAIARESSHNELQRGSRQRLRQKVAEASTQTLILTFARRIRCHGHNRQRGKSFVPFEQPDSLEHFIAIQLRNLDVHQNKPQFLVLRLH